jgi:hypothetical protein
MKRIILFRFSKELTVCENRLQLLKHMNPIIPIYGIFGGADGEADIYMEKLNGYFDHFWTITNKTKSWKWMNIDLALRDWYREIGNTLDEDPLDTPVEPAAQPVTEESTDTASPSDSESQVSE